MRARPTVLWLLAIGMLVTGGLAVKVELDKRRLVADYRQTQESLLQIQIERAALSQQLDDVRRTVETQTTDLSRMQQELARLQTTLQQAELELVQLRTATAQWQEANAQLTEEKAMLEAKLSSINTLKIAIRDLRHQMWRERWQAWVARLQQQRAASQTVLAQGNRGFVVRNGVSTLGAVTKLQVRVLDPEAQ